MYLNELIDMVAENDCQGIYVNESHPNVNMLLYADDVIIVGDQINRVQILLNTLHEFCKKWGLAVNMRKTQAIVYRNGGIVKKNECFYFNKQKIKIVPYYKYLGLTMSSRLSWSPAQTTLSAQATKALRVISQINYECDYSFKCAVDIFDKCVLPILTYGSEIWGPDINNVTERVHVNFCKKQLGVGVNTPTAAVLGECGRDSIYITCYKRCIKYWLKLMQLQETSLLRSSYSLQLQQCNSGKTNWASKVRDILYKYGYGYVWEAQNVTNVDSFMKEFVQRLKDCECQEWSSNVSQISKLRTYCVFKEDRSVESYLSLDIPRRLRSCIARFRTGCHNLQIEIGRHENIPLENRLCKYCMECEQIQVIEDEYHVLFECGWYKEVREWYIKKYCDNFNMFYFISLMKNKDEKCIKDVTNFIAHIFRCRNEIYLY
jgi:hypothetical protein